MKVTSSALSLVLLLVVACASASPMFGTGGMMKRKFPGATDMSYRTYREIANSNARGDTPSAAPAAGVGAPAPAAGVGAPAPAVGVGAPAPAAGVALRSGGSSAGGSGWMFGNDLAAPSSLSSNQPGSFTQQQASFNQQGLPFYPQNLEPQDPFVERYPSVWDPRDSYAFLQFPYHGAYVPQDKIYRNYY